ncbi:N-acetylmuramoyl-L-alanine amidase [Streptomyces sp. XD-27]|uniref:N-acetylmuramoyl-L-alanine amidase n=1 Tax=Streptomyces sp. XD-27 TaxID=3062779 RepID=UPI0026F40F78|nr:N-acetylmuramoyl-L-alanine amidase [Streptomyces sp. XD-27]WKX69137.1 N-acetylmuramoyl-L-alanine amidase [Streptomyces sp. XD-27]
MWPRRLTRAVALVPLALLVTWDAPERWTPEPRQPHEAAARPAAPRPAIVGRASWHADETAVREKPRYAGSVAAVFVHHTDHPHDYDCRADVPGMLRAMQDDHTHGEGWDDLGYNFVVDRCGTIYEGRAGGVDRAVVGAHTKGFNTGSTGIAALGHFGAGEEVPRPMLEAIAALAAWKLRPGADPRGRVRMVSTNDASRYPKGTSVELDVIAGHRDGYETDCPGGALYGRLPWLREEAARLRSP